MTMSTLHYTTSFGPVPDLVHAGTVCRDASETRPAHEIWYWHHPTMQFFIAQLIVDGEVIVEDCGHTRKEALASAYRVLPFFLKNR